MIHADPKTRQQCEACARFKQYPLTMYISVIMDIDMEVSCLIDTCSKAGMECTEKMLQSFVWPGLGHLVYRDNYRTKRIHFQSFNRHVAHAGQFQSKTCQFQQHLSPLEIHTWTMGMKCTWNIHAEMPSGRGRPLQLMLRGVLLSGSRSLYETIAMPIMVRITAQCPQWSSEM